MRWITPQQEELFRVEAFTLDNKLDLTIAMSSWWYSTRLMAILGGCGFRRSVHNELNVLSLMRSVFTRQRRSSTDDEGGCHHDNDGEA